MKRRLVMAFFLALLLFAIPATALAAEMSPVTAYGTLDSISVSIEKPAGESGRVVVLERTLEGTFLSGDLAGAFSITYHTNVVLLTQAGNIAGSLRWGDLVFRLNGKSQPVTWVPVPGGMIGQLTVTGKWELTGGKGKGTFEAFLVFVPTEAGHIARLLPGSCLSVSGSWSR